MYHSITFGNKNTWDDWHLIPLSRPVFNPPALKGKVIDLPGTSESIDLSTTFSGEPLFTNRTGTFEFAVDQGHQGWEQNITAIREHLHGRYLQASLEDDPDYYYEGFFFLESLEPGAFFSKVVIGYNVGPYKINLGANPDYWEWDPFDFENGVIGGYKDLVVDGPDSLSLSISGYGVAVSPVFTASEQLTVTFKGDTYTIRKGTGPVAGLYLTNGDNLLVFSGTGIITIDYKGGSL